MSPPVEHGNPVDNPDAFRRSLGQFATGVTVVTACAPDGRIAGVTSNSFASVSLDPPLVLWSLKRSSQSLAAFETATHFAINVLSLQQMDLSHKFARSSAEKFNGVDWHVGRGGSPLLSGAAATFECRRTVVHEGGDHVIVLGHVEYFNRYDSSVLVFSQGRYAVAAEHPDSRINSLGAPAIGGGGDPLLSLLLARAYATIAGALEKARKAEGLGMSLMQARFLKALHMFPGRTLEDLLPELFLALNASQHVLHSLRSDGLVELDAEGRLYLTAHGLERIREIDAHTRRAEDRQLRFLDATDLATTRRLLAGIATSAEK